jgi:hypothetical protein
LNSKIKGIPVVLIVMTGLILLGVLVPMSLLHSASLRTEEATQRQLEGVQAQLDQLMVTPSVSPTPEVSVTPTKAVLRVPTRVSSPSAR